MILLKNINYLDIENEKIINDIDILIKDDKIEKIGKNLEFNAQVYNMENHLAIPAIVNGHTHLGMTMMRNLADDLNLQTWLNTKIWPLEAKLTDEDIYWSTVLSLIENMKSGVALTCDMYASMDYVAKAVLESKTRCVLTRGLMDMDGNGENRLDEFKDLYKKFNDDKYIKVLPAPHAIYTCSTDYLKEILKISNEYNTMINIHLSETMIEVKESIEKYKLTPLMYLKSLGYLNNHIIAAHCTHLTDEEIREIENKNFYPIYNPSSNLKLASGFTPIQKMLNHNIKIGIGTDGSSSNNNQDMFEEMHLAGLVNKAKDNDPTSVKAINVLKMATINNREIFKFNNGIIKENTFADIAILDLDSLSFTPKNNLISALCYSASSYDVKHLIIGGEFVMKNREILTLDEEKAKYMVNKLTEDILRR